MVNKLNIQVTFGGKTKVFECATRREFFNVICKEFSVSKEAIQLLDKEKQKPITINDLCNNMKVELRKLPANVQRNGPAENVEKVPDRDVLVEKLINNSVLSGLERKFIVNNIDKLYQSSKPESVKRKNENEIRNTSNKKVQVPLEGVHFKNALSQTENLTPQTVQNKTPSTSRKLQSVSIPLAEGEISEPEKMMADSFFTRRNFILMNNPVVSFVKEQYPHLFSVSGIRNELQRIFFPGKDVKFLSNIEKFSGAILDIVNEDDSLLKVIKDIYQSAKKPSEKKYAKEVGALLIISNLVNERRLYLNTLDEPSPMSNYPRIEANCEVKELFYDKQVYNVMVEGIHLCEATDFKEAILCLMATYFVFNISYPDKLFSTLVLMEKVFLEANDTDGNEIDQHADQVIKLILLKPDAKNKFLKQ